MDLPILFGFVSQCRYGIVSSTSPEGRSQSALVGIAVTRNLELIFDTLKTSRKYRNLVARPDCSFVVGWADERTLQLEGMAFNLETLERTCYEETYFAAWPECRAHSTLPDITYFVVRPNWVRYSDYNCSPALIEEVSLDQP